MNDKSSKTETESRKNTITQTYIYRNTNKLYLKQLVEPTHLTTKIILKCVKLVIKSFAYRNEKRTRETERT